MRVRFLCLLPLAVVALSCKPSEAPSATFEPAAGAMLSSKCPVRVTFAGSVSAANITFNGDIAAGVTVIPRSTSAESTTLEFYPSPEGWKPGKRTFSIKLSIVSGGGTVSAKYDVVKEADEDWKRSPSHDTGKFLQGAVRDVWFANATTGFAVGAGVMKTTDSGATWSQVATDTSKGFVVVTGLDASTVWVIDLENKVLKSGDGGATWTVLAKLPRRALSLVALDADTLLVGTEFGLYRSSDAGATFKVVSPSGTKWTSLVVESPSRIWALGAELHLSTDKGASWTAAPTGLKLSALSGDGAGALWAVGGDETIAVSIDGGPWVRQHARDGGEALLDVFASDPLHVWAIDAKGGVYRTADGGAGWEEQRATLPTGAMALYGIARDRLWASGEQGLANTTNGASWTHSTPGLDRTLTSVWVSDTQTLTAVGELGVVLTSSTAGAQWALRDAGTAATFTDVWGTGSERFASTIDGTILHSGNAGATWQPRANVGMPVRGIFGVDAKNLWAVGDHCVIAGTEVFRSTDGAQSWQPSSTLKTVYCLSDVWASDAMHVWAVGHRAGKFPLTEAVVVKSDDGGQTWTEVAVGDGSLNAIWGADASRLWVTGRATTLTESQGLAASSQNGGESWTREFWGPLTLDSDVWVSSDNLAWAAGTEGVLSTAGPCNAPAGQPRVGLEDYRAVHGTADGKQVWIVGEHGLVATLRRP
jgi:photosystem II stability/assembly factor-like uncharacterized protein